LLFIFFIGNQLLAREIYVSPAGSDNSNGSFASPFASLYKAAQVLAAGDTLTVLEGTYKLTSVGHGFRFSSIGSRERPILIRAQGAVYLEDSQTNNWNTLNWDGILKIENAQWITVDGFRIRHSGSHGILVNHSHHIQVRNNLTDRTLGSGISVWSSQNITIDSNEITRACNQGQSFRGTACQECLTIAQTDTFEVSYNHIHDNIQEENPDQHAGGGEGLDIKDGSKNGIVHHNRIYNTTQLGLYIEAWDKHVENIDVFSNEIHHNVFGIVVTIENGGTMKNIRIYNNIIHSK
jgi:hypothetical protein